MRLVSWIRRALVLLGALVLLAALAGAGFVLLGGRVTFTPPMALVESAAGALLSRPVAVRGHLQITLSRWTGLQAREFTVAGIGGASPVELLRIESGRAEVDLPRLLTGSVQIRDLVSDGTFLWIDGLLLQAFMAGFEGWTDRASRRLHGIDRFRLSRVDVSYPAADAPGRRSVRLRSAEGQVLPGSRLTVQVSGEVGARPVEGRLSLSPAPAGDLSSGAWSLDATARLAALTLRAAGTLHPGGNWAGTTVSLEADGAWARPDGLPSLPVAAEALLEVEDTTARLSGLRLAVGRTRVDGGMTLAGDAPQAVVTAELRVDSGAIPVPGAGERGDWPVRASHLLQSLERSGIAEVRATLRGRAGRIPWHGEARVSTDGGGRRLRVRVSGRDVDPGRLLPLLGQVGDGVEGVIRELGVEVTARADPPALVPRGESLRFTFVDASARRDGRGGRRPLAMRLTEGAGELGPGPRGSLSLAGNVEGHAVRLRLDSGASEGSDRATVPVDLDLRAGALRATAQAGLETPAALSGLRFTGVDVRLAAPLFSADATAPSVLIGADGTVTLDVLDIERMSAVLSWHAGEGWRAAGVPVVSLAKGAAGGGDWLRLGRATLTGAGAVTVRDATVSPVIEDRWQLDRFQFLAARTGHPTHVHLEATVDPWSRLGLVAVHRHDAGPRDWDVDGWAENLNLPRLSPYTAADFGFNVQSGQADGTLHLSLRDGRLDGRSDLAIHLPNIQTADEARLREFEKRLPMSLTLKEVLRLLRNDERRIDLTVPISGETAHPELGLDVDVEDAIHQAIKEYVAVGLTFVDPVLGVVAAAVVGREAGNRYLEPVVFAPGRTELGEGARARLDEIVRRLESEPGRSMVVCGVAVPADRGALAVGGADAGEPGLLALAEDRAEAVKHHLVRHGGIRPERLIACLAEFDPGESVREGEPATYGTRTRRPEPRVDLGI